MSDQQSADKHQEHELLKLQHQLGMPTKTKQKKGGLSSRIEKVCQELKSKFDVESSCNIDEAAVEENVESVSGRSSSEDDEKSKEEEARSSCKVEQIDDKV